ncbi:SUMF1/EgtB/PvdO family nonheme iron enzyme [bacterium]|nr:SUMF1/EgtB/PvdO family nonheme iron enzyme [bacterium]
MLKSQSLLALSLCFAAAALFAGEAELWSGSFSFKGQEINQEEPLLLKTSDKIAYSSILAKGDPQALKIDVVDVNDPSINVTLFNNTSGRAVEGSFVWDYTQPQFDDFNQFSSYVITETVTGSQETKAYPRTINLVPEPAVLILIGIVGAFFLRRRAKALLAVLALATLCASNASAFCYVTKVDCLQLFPFSRTVVINYTVESDSTEIFNVKFYGSTDDGETVFDLSEKGTLANDGAKGLLISAGDHKTLWTPDESFYETDTDNMKVKVKIEERDGMPYCAYDLETGEYSYVDKDPSGEWADEYKTTKMVFAYVPAGTFTMGSPSGEIGRQANQEIQHTVTITKPFYMGVFEVTQKQYELITGSNPSESKGDNRPVEQVSYDMIRGAEKGAQWPANNEVDEDSFLGKLRAQTGKAYDLPTEAQWEYACRATTGTALNTGKDLTDECQCPNMDEAGRYAWDTNDGKGDIYYRKHTVVGCYLPNQWGLYDCHGNVAEICLDWAYTRSSADPQVDPVGPATGTTRMIRGGGNIDDAEYCRSATRGASVWPNTANYNVGFRLVVPFED